METKIRSILQELNPYEQFDNNTELVESGILNSLTIFQMVTMLEVEFNIIIDDTDITKEHVKSVKAIMAWITEIKAKNK